MAPTTVAMARGSAAGTTATTRRCSSGRGGSRLPPVVVTRAVALPPVPVGRPDGAPSAPTRTAAPSRKPQRLNRPRKPSTPLPAPPPAPEHLLDFPMADVAPKMLGTLAVLAGLQEVACLAAQGDGLPFADHIWALSMVASGVVSVPLLFWQHDLVHLRDDKREGYHDLLEPALAVLTGVPLAVSHFVHEFHHAVPTMYQGLDVDKPPQPHNTADEIGDPDDMWFVFRKGMPSQVCRAVKKNPALRAAMVGAVAMKSMLIFQPIAMTHGLIRPVEAELHGRGDAVNRLGFAAVAAHLLIGHQLVGLEGLALYGLGLSVASTALGTLFHDQSGLNGNSDYWYQQIKATCNPRDHDHPVIKHMLNGQDYHIEHHLWPKVPSENLWQLAHVAKKYCEDNGLEYEEVEPLEAFQRSLRVGWDLVATSEEDAARSMQSADKSNKVAENN